LDCGGLSTLLALSLEGLALSGEGLALNLEGSFKGPPLLRLKATPPDCNPSPAPVPSQSPRIKFLDQWQCAKNFLCFLPAPTFENQYSLSRVSPEVYFANDTSLAQFPSFGGLPRV